MFSHAKKNEESPINSSNIIGKETIIEGNISTRGNVRLEGTLIGNLISKAKIVLGNESKLEGKIVAQNAEIAGTVEGIIEISELLILKPSAIVIGDIITKKLVFEKEAKFNGKCSMFTENNVKIENKQKQKINATEAVS